MNEEWCQSQECLCEYNIALATKNKNNTPQIFPVFMEPYDFFRKNMEYPYHDKFKLIFFNVVKRKFPVAYAMTCNYHGVFVTKNELSIALWDKLLDAISSV